MPTVAIIPAAGVGTRMGGDRPKQFFALGGVPILIRTLRKFNASPQIHRVLVPLREDEFSEFTHLIDAESFQKPVECVVGGDHRQESVSNALQRVDERAFDYVVVHDAVRPFVSLDLIERSLLEAHRIGAAVCAIPVMDTVKQIERQRVVATMPREKIVLVQTPQAFRTDLLRQAFQRAESESFFGTDEAMLVEHFGAEVGVVLGHDHNIKITRPADIPLAEFLLDLEMKEAVAKP